MTELTDEEAKALLAECDNPDCLTCEYARALLDARAELARVKADAAAAQALMVERAAEVCDDLAIGYAKHKGVPDALHDAARDIRALTPDAGTAELVRLRERAEKDGNNG